MDRSTLVGPVPTLAGEPWPSSARAWYAVLITGLSVTFAQLDMGIMSLLVEPIKHDLHLSDFQISLLLGFAFIVFYTFIGLPLARFVDRSSRTMMLTLGIAAWSVATAASGLAQNFVELFICRVFVGAGELINGPATFSLLADYFPKEKLPRAIGVMQVGQIAGSGLSLLLGGFVIHELMHVSAIHVPFIGAIRDWQLVFFAVGLPGLIVAVLMATVREPKRRGLVVEGRSAHVPMRAVIKYIVANWRLYAPMFVGLAFGVINASGSMMWAPAFYQRTYGWMPDKTGMITGVATLIFMPIGLVIGIWMSERFTKNGQDDSNLRVMFLSRLIGVPALTLMPLMPNPWAAVILGGFGMLTVALGGPSYNAALQIVTPNQMRGQITALFLFIYFVVGVGLGPTVVATLTDVVLHNPQELRYALALVSIVFGPTSAFILWLGLRPYGEAVAHFRKIEA